jgi:hypothetical protein
MIDVVLVIAWLPTAARIEHGGDNVRRAHVPAWVVILVDREDPGVVWVLVVQGTEILRVLGDENEPVPLSIAKMNLVGFPGDSGVCWPNHDVPRAGEQLGKRVRVGAGV